MRCSNPRILAAIGCALTAGGLIGCSESLRLGTAPEPPDAGCTRPEQPQTFQVYFVQDVSGSMGIFLTDLSKELLSFASGFPKFDSQGRPVRVEYHVVAFVKDVKTYGGRMTSVIALQAAFDEAIARGQTNLNLTSDTLSAGGVAENMLDALGEVIDQKPTAEAKLIMLSADDDGFAEAPEVLPPNIHVKWKYTDVRAGLERMGARIHAFVTGPIDGVTRMYKGQPSLTSLPGASVHSLGQLQGASEEIRKTLSFIAREAACN